MKKHLDDKKKEIENRQTQMNKREVQFLHEKEKILSEKAVLELKVKKMSAMLAESVDHSQHEETVAAYNLILDEVVHLRAKHDAIEKQLQEKISINEELEGSHLELHQQLKIKEVSVKQDFGNDCECFHWVPNTASRTVAFKSCALFLIIFKCWQNTTNEFN